MNGYAAWLVGLAMWATACNDKADDSGKPVGGASVQITSPPDGGFVDEGDSVTLSAKATDADALTLTIDSAIWTTDGWTASGNDITVTDLPAGTLDLSVEVEAVGQTLTDTIVLYVYASTDDRGSN